MKTWKLEPLYVLRNEQDVVIEVRQTMPIGYEPADTEEFMKLRYSKADLKRENVTNDSR